MEQKDFSFPSSLLECVAFFLMIDILTGVIRNLKLVLICISLMSNNVEHLFNFLSHLFYLLRTP